MNLSELERVAHAMVAPGKGLLAADESTSTIKKRFDTISLESTEEHRRAYRDMLFTTPEIDKWISGVIMYDETLRQKTSDGVPFAQYLSSRSIIPGIKVDLGAKPLALFPNETITEGLDGLRERFSEYAKLGARFAKWRAVINIADGVPTYAAIEANAQALARYAALAQDQGIVPIVEPEVLMDGGHTLERCEEVTDLVLAIVFQQLRLQRIELTGMILKPNMVIPGKKSTARTTPEQVANATIRCLKRQVPGRGARHHVPLRRPKSGRSHAAPVTDESLAAAALAAVLQLRSGTAGAGDERLARDQCGRRSARVPQVVPPERTRP